MKVAVVPAKDFGTAKQRLARALPGEARSALARAMSSGGSRKTPPKPPAEGGGEAATRSGTPRPRAQE
jgi:hypothetical protein